MAAASTVPGLDTAHLEEHGWAIVRGVVDPGVCARACRCIDDILGPAVHTVQADGRGQSDEALEATGSRWPDPEGLPLISSGGPWRTKVMHPIRDSVTAELVAPLAPLFAELYRCERPQDLKLLQHMFTRTDALPPTESAAATDSSSPSWHLDDAFLEEHRTSTPMQMYYHSMLALSPVRANGAPYLVCPHSMRRAREIVRGLGDAEDLFDPGEGRTVLPALILPRIPKEEGPPHEIYLEQGDLLIHDPMLTHSASDNLGAVPSRHVVFSTFFDASAIGRTLVGLRNRMAAAPPSKFPRELREALPQEWRSLLEWELPLQDESRAQSLAEQSRILSAGVTSMEEKGRAEAEPAAEGAQGGSSSSSSSRKHDGAPRL